MKKVRVIPVKWINENHDSDYDGVPNYLDCEPFNPHKQDNNLSVAIQYLQDAIKSYSKEPIKKCKRFMMSLSKEERDRIIMDDKFQELLYIIERKVLVDIDPSHVPFGPL